MNDENMINLLNKVMTSENESLTEKELSLKDNLSNFIRSTISENLSVNVSVSDASDGYGENRRARVQVSLDMIEVENGKEYNNQFSEDSDSE